MRGASRLEPPEDDQDIMQHQRKKLSHEKNSSFLHHDRNARHDEFKKNVGPGDDASVNSSSASSSRSEVPSELVGAWEHGSTDFALWENYKEGYYAGRNAAPTREAMIMGKNGDAKFYRYEAASGL